MDPFETSLLDGNHEGRRISSSVAIEPLRAPIRVPPPQRAAGRSSLVSSAASPASSPIALPESTISTTLKYANLSRIDLLTRLDFEREKLEFEIDKELAAQTQVDQANRRVANAKEKQRLGRIEIKHIESLLTGAIKRVLSPGSGSQSPQSTFQSASQSALSISNQHSQQSSLQSHDLQMTATSLNQAPRTTTSRTVQLQSSHISLNTSSNLRESTRHIPGPRSKTLERNMALDIPIIPTTRPDIHRSGITQLNRSRSRSLERQKDRDIQRDQRDRDLQRTNEVHIEEDTQREKIIQIGTGVRPESRGAPDDTHSVSSGSDIEHISTTRTTSPAEVILSSGIAPLAPIDITFDDSLRNWTIQSNTTRQVIRPASMKLGKLMRKARSLVIYPSTHAGLEDVALTPTVGTSGAIQVWDLKTRVQMRVIPSCDVVGMLFCEDVNWVAPTTLAIAPSDRLVVDGHQSQLTLLRNCKVVEEQMRFDVSYLNETPHTRPISQVVGVGREGRFVTGGRDHRVVLWSCRDVERRVMRFECVGLHTIHTSAVTALLYTAGNRMVHSGGLDSRLVTCDLESGKTYGGSKREAGTIKELLGVHLHDNLLVAGIVLRNISNFTVYDLRTNKPSLVIDRGPSTSIYNRASIHNNGMLLTAGDDLFGIQIWDLRYVNVSKSSQTINIHKKPVIAATFWKDKLVSVSSDNDILLTGYK